MTPQSHKFANLLNYQLIISLLVITPFLAAFGPLSQTGSAHGRPKTQPRPFLSGPLLHHDTEHFRIHYTLAGEDAISAVDETDDDMPDYIEAVAEALEYSWVQEIEHLGWLTPLPDEGEGGDLRLDVYLERQEELYGYMDTLEGYVGDNPATKLKEAEVAYGYISLSNDYSTDFYEEASPLGAMRTTAAHELHHAIQSAYDDADSQIWLYEATATWMESEVYPDLGGAESYLSDYMDAPDICPLSVGRDDEDVRWYASWVLLRYIADHYGGPATIRHLWEYMAEKDGLEAMALILAEQKTTLAEVLVDFSLANLTKADCPDNAPYCYAKGSHYLRPFVERIIQIDEGEQDTYIPQDGVQQFGADYLRLKSDRAVKIAFQGSAAGVWQVYLAAIEGDMTTVTPVEVATITVVEPISSARLYLVIVNTAPVAGESDCGYHNYTLALADAAYQGQVVAPAVPDDPGPYVPPSYEETEEVSDTTFPSPDIGQPVSAEEVPFDLLYAGYLPSEYTFSEILRYDPTDLGEWQQDYAPGGEPIITLNYTGSTEEAYIALTASPSPYETIEDWVEAQGYYENQLRLINNHSVFLVDYSAEDGPFSSATFVYDELFIAIDGTVDFIEMQQVVAGFLAHNASP